LAVVCATEAPLSEAMLDGWLAMRIYADCDEGAHNAIPFGTGRGGIALGEAAVCMIVEELDSALARGAQPLAEIVGVGESSDAHSLVKPHVEGQIEAMRAALADGGIRPSDVGYVNAHATGTSVGDPTEAQAIAEVFPDRPWVSSTKGLHGHTLGAAGLLELGVVIAGMKSSLVPAGFGLEAIGSDCAELRHVTTVTAWPEGLSCAMSNSFAFGGHNVSIVVRRV
jgi:3-oxoacyl-(acyl-carrier-protein) synthase